MKKAKKILITGVLIIILISGISYNRYDTLSQVVSSIKIENLSKENMSNSLSTEIDNTDVKISFIQNELSEKRNILSEINSEVSTLQSGKRYTLGNPTDWGAYVFIRTDITNEQVYNQDSFNCLNFAQRVINNAEKQGIRCGLVTIELVNESHAIVVFNTTDKGLVYYEPQNDARVNNLHIGKDYWADCVTPPPGCYYPGDPNNIIENFTIYW